MKPNSVKIYIKESNMNLYSWEMIADGFLFSTSIIKYIGSSLKSTLLIAKKDNGIWCVEQFSWNDLGKKVNEKLENHKLNIDQLLKDHLEVGERLFELSEEFLNKDIKKLANADFIKYFSFMWVDNLELNGLGFMPVISDLDHNYLSKKLIDILERHEKDAQQIQSHLSLLISGAKPDLNWQELLDFLTLIKKHQTLNRLKKAKQLGQHIQKYNWINFGYIGPVWTKKDFLERAKKIINADESIATQYFRHKNHFKDLKKKQIKLEKELRLSKHERFLFEAARMFMFLKAYRLNVRHKVQYVSELIFKESCNRYKLQIDSFRYATREEIVDFLSGQAVDMRKIAARRNGMVEITENSKRQILSLGKSKKLLDKLLIKEEIKQADFVTGQAAFLGRVKGKAKIIFDTKDMSKVNRGDILISISTTPDLLPAMYKAAAFVTDSGGITSHAAIVARELKKPCIIGTKFGTKIFKDGDMVEVDANKGIVRKI